MHRDHSRSMEKIKLYIYTNVCIHIINDNFLQQNRIGLQRIDLVLDHPQKVYYSGHEISGKVHLYLDEPVNAIGKSNYFHYFCLLFFFLF